MESGSGGAAGLEAMAKRLQQAMTIAGTWLSRPWAVGAVLLYAVLWLTFQPRGFGWHGVATIATLLMTLFIQRSEHRDTQAIHALAAHHDLECFVGQMSRARIQTSRSSSVVRITTAVRHRPRSTLLVRMHPFIGRDLPRLGQLDHAHRRCIAALLARPAFQGRL
jgi:hypothetical protein